MELLIFLKSIFLGFIVAVPIGPVGIICIRKTLTSGRRMGLSTGLGAALADGIYGIIAAFGVKAAAHFLYIFRSPIEIIGGMCIVYLGYRSFYKRHHPDTLETTETESEIVSAVSAFFLTLTNPLTLVTFTLVFAGLGLGRGTRPLTASLVVLGVAIGSFLWWIIVANIVSYLKTKFTHKTLNTINIVTGAILIVLGILSIISGALRIHI